jgi:hypothetical protein
MNTEGRNLLDICIENHGTIIKGFLTTAQALNMAQMIIFYFKFEVIEILNSKIII